MTKSIRFPAVLILFSVLVFFAIQNTPAQSVSSTPAAEPVVIVDQGRYFQVIINFETGLSHRQLGQAYAQKISKAVPEFEAIVDSYLSEITGNNDQAYAEFIRRAADIKPQLDPAYREEIEGLTAELTGKDNNRRGDGKLSRDEAFVLNLIPDVARGSCCNAFAVYGKRSATGKTILERTLDWHDGSRNQAANLQAVVTLKNGKKTVTLVGYLGFLGAITAYNDHGVFAAILDSPTGKPYPGAAGKRSYPMDIRHALENNTTLDAVAGYLKDPAKAYTFNHLVFLADADTAKVLENNLSGPRVLRTGTSELHPGIIWNQPDSIAVVNAFLLKGGENNFPMYNINKARWESFKSLLQAKFTPLSVDDVKRIASYRTGPMPGKQPAGDLYNRGTHQIIVFQPATKSLEVFFRPKNGNLSADPDFVKVPTP